LSKKRSGRISLSTAGAGFEKEQEVELNEIEYRNELFGFSELET
jgi:hypothetical protein